jgi:hypothetical protein
LCVTLYGVSSLKEINDQFFEQLHPVLASKGMKITGKVLKGFLKGALKVDLGKSEFDLESNLSEIRLPDYLTNTDSKIIVFDDLERCSMEIENVLGYINQFVEINGNKVILVANEEEIISKETQKIKEEKFDKIKGKLDNKNFEAIIEKNKDKKVKYLQIKEKLIGKSFEITSNFDEALDEFIKELADDSIISLIKTNRAIIADLYGHSGYNNLRHLKQSILDLERFFSMIPKSAFVNELLVKDLTSWFLALSFELKAGNIIEDDLKKIFFADLSFDTDKSSIYKNLKDKYFIELYAFPLNATLWFEFFKKGMLNKEDTEISLNNSRYFEKENTPPWIKLWRWRDLDDNEFDSLYKTVYNYFKSKKVDEQYLLVHITSMLIYLAEFKMIPVGKEKIVSIAKENIKSLKTKHKLLFDNSEFFPGPAYGSLGYHGMDILEFKDFIDYFKKELKDSLINSYSKLPKELLSLMEKSPETFRQKINLTNSSENKYFNIPVLKDISAQKFLTSYLKLSNRNKSFINLVLDERYKYGELAKDLIDELNWLKKIKDKLKIEKDKRIKKPSGFIIQNLIAIIDEVIVKLESI